MERQKKVIDASILVKFFTQESGSEKVAELIRKHISEEIILLAPEIIFLEVLNALKYKKVDKKFLQQTVKDLHELQLEISYLDEFLTDRAVEASIKNNLSIYDGLYAAMSQINGVQLITEDKELLKLHNSTSLNNF